MDHASCSGNCRVGFRILKWCNQTLSHSTTAGEVILHLIFKIICLHHACHLSPARILLPRKAHVPVSVKCCELCFVWYTFLKCAVIVWGERDDGWHEQRCRCWLMLLRSPIINCAGKATPAAKNQAMQTQYMIPGRSSSLGGWWNPGEAVDSPSLEVFKAELARAWSNLG